MQNAPLQERLSKAYEEKAKSQCKHTSQVLLYQTNIHCLNTSNEVVACSCTKPKLACSCIFAHFVKRHLELKSMNDQKFTAKTISIKSKT